VNVICPTPSAVHQCGGNTAATVCTQLPACHPSVNVICPTPTAVQHCGAQQATPPSFIPGCNQHPSIGQCHPTIQAFPTMQGCPPVTTNCMTIPARCGVFTPFCQQ
jgi:hypothetical protein